MKTGIEKVAQPWPHPTVKDTTVHSGAASASQTHSPAVQQDPRHVQVVVSVGNQCSNFFFLHEMQTQRNKRGGGGATECASMDDSPKRHSLSWLRICMCEGFCARCLLGDAPPTAGWKSANGTDLWRSVCQEGLCRGRCTPLGAICQGRGVWVLGPVRLPHLLQLGVAEEGGDALRGGVQPRSRGQYGRRGRLMGRKLPPDSGCRSFPWCGRMCIHWLCGWRVSPHPSQISATAHRGQGSGAGGEARLAGRGGQGRTATPSAPKAPKQGNRSLAHVVGCAPPPPTRTHTERERECVCVCVCVWVVWRANSRNRGYRPYSCQLP